MAYKMKGMSFKNSPNKQKKDLYKTPVGPRATKKKVKRNDNVPLSPGFEDPIKIQRLQREGLTPDSQEFHKKAKAKAKSPAKQDDNVGSAGVINMDLLRSIGYQLGSTTKEGKSKELTDYGKLISELGPGLEGIMKDMKDIKEQKRKDALEQQKAEEIKKKVGNNNDSSNDDSSNGDSSNGNSEGSPAEYKTPYKMKYSKRNFPFK